MTGVGLWLCLLVAIAYSPLQIFVPIFLQSLHGLDPLERGLHGGGRLVRLDGHVARRRRHAGATQRPPADRRAAHDGGGSARRRPADAAEAGAGRLSGDRAGRRRHRRVLGLHCPEGHERRAGGRGESCGFVGGDRAADRLRAGRGARRPRRQCRRPVGRIDPHRRRRSGVLGADEFCAGGTRRRRCRRAAGAAASTGVLPGAVRARATPSFPRAPCRRPRTGRG